MNIGTIEKSVSKIQSDFAKLSKVKAKLTAEKDEISKKIDKIDNILANFSIVNQTTIPEKAVKKVSKRSGNRVQRGLLIQTLENVFNENKGKITTKDAIAAFEKAKIPTAANAVLMRMKKKGEIENPERGVWVRHKKAA